MTAGSHADVPECVKSQRPDGRHSWRFDGDDPYVLCAFCGERRDALSGKVIGGTSAQSDVPARLREKAERIIRLADLITARELLENDLRTANAEMERMNIALSRIEEASK